MKTLPIMLLILASSLLSTKTASAQNKPLACQVEEAAGLDWENGRWVTTKFVTSKFILVQAGNNLTNESIAKVLNNPDPKQITCRYSAPEFTCFDHAGQTLYFNPIALKGGKSRLFGSTEIGTKKRDSVAVEIFSCTPF
jgi:hypothetical protein